MSNTWEPSTQAADNAQTTNEMLHDVFDLLEEQALQVKTAGLKITRVDSAPATITVLRGQDLEQLGARTLAEALAFVPGFTLSMTRTGETRIGVRRRSTERSEGVKVLLDGHSVVEPWYGGAAFQFADYPLNNIDRIEIIRGPGSAVHGANAFVGVINIISKNVDRSGAKVRVDAGRFDAPVVSAWGGWKKGAHSLTLDATFWNHLLDSRVIASDSLIGTPNETRSHSAQARVLGSAKRLGQANTPARYITARAAYAYEERTRVSVQYVRQDRGDFAGEFFQLTYFPGQENPSRIFEDRLWVDIRHEQPITDKIHLFGHAYADWAREERNLRLTIERWQSFDDRDGDGALDFSPDGLRRLRHAEALVGGAEVGVSAELPFHNQLSAALVYEASAQVNTYQRANFNPRSLVVFADPALVPVESYTRGGYLRHVLSVYAEDAFTPRKELNLTVGMRVDRYSDFGWAYSPRAALVSKFDFGLTLKALWGLAFRAPGFQELYFRGDPTLVGNPSLKAENANTGELQANFQRALPWLGQKTDSDNTTEESLPGKQGWRSFQVSATGYLTEIRNAIRPDYERVFGPPYRRINVDAVRYYGVEAELVFPLFRWWRLRSNLSFGRAFSASPYALAGVDTPEWKVAGISQWNVPFVGVLSAGAVGLGMHPRAPGDIRPPLMPSVELSATWVSVPWTFWKTTWRARVAAKNVLNSNLLYPSPVYQGTAGEAAFPNDFPRMGINVWGGMEAAWE